MSSSRDFGFITLRSMQAYQSNGSRVPPNYLLAVSSGGAAIFTDDVYISSITASTIDVNTLNASTIDVNTLNASTIDVNTLNASTIDVNTLNASTIDVSTLNASTINVSTLNASTINVSTLNASSIITDYLTVNSTANTAFLTVTNPLNDIITSTVFSVNANSADTFLVSNIYDAGRNYMDVNIVNNQSDPFSSDIKFIKSHPGNPNNTTVTGDELGYVSFWGTNTTGDRARASFIRTQQYGNADATTVPGNIEFYTTSTSQSDVLRMNITPDNIIATPRLTINAGANDTIAGAMSIFARTASSGTRTEEYQVAGDISGFAGTWQDARYVYNTTAAPYEVPVWGIATSSIAASLVAPTIGDIRFYNDVYLTKNINIDGNLNATGTALSRVVTSTINADPAATTSWPNFYGKYCFVSSNINSLTIPTSPTPSDGTTIVIINANTVDPQITVNGNTIAATQTLSFVYATITGELSGKWYTL